MPNFSLIQISYATLKSEFASKSLKMFYTQLFAEDGITTAGYSIFVMSPSYGLKTTISDASDISDFEANYKASATSVGVDEEAIARSMQPQMTSPILPSSQSGRSYGYTATSAASSKTIRATAYTPPGNNAQRSIVSTSAADAAAGTGARTVKITYLDATGAGPFTETLTLNGTTAVNTVNTNIALIERMDVLTVGSGGGNAGTINLRTLVNGGGTTIGSIAVGDNQTNWVHHYVPIGKVCYVLLLEGASTVAAGGLSVSVLNPVNTAIAQVQPDTTIRHGTTYISRPFPVPLVVTGPAIVFMNERPDVATASTVFAGFHWIQQ